MHSEKAEKNNGDETVSAIKTFEKASESTLLGGVLSNHMDGILDDDAIYRRYVGSVNTSCTINDHPDTNKKTIIYEIGRVRLNTVSICDNDKKNKKNKKNTVKELAKKLIHESHSKSLDEQKTKKERRVEKNTRDKAGSVQDIITKLSVTEELNVQKKSDDSLELIDDPGLLLDDDSSDDEMGNYVCRSISQSISIDGVFNAELIGMHRKIANYTGKHDYMDLSGVAFVLALSIGHYVNTGKLTCADMRFGKSINIRALGTAFDPVSSSPNSVFVPRQVQKIMAPGVFCALTSAINAYGSTVFTDCIEVDEGNNTLLVEFSDAALVGGCFEALRLLFVLYDKCEAGSTIAFAAIKGFHTINSVVSHTDEGGWFRDLLRKGFFCPPFGAIYVEETKNFLGFPIPSIYSPASVTAVVDSILLISAAGVTLCDPLVMVKESMFPTVFTCKPKGSDQQLFDYERQCFKSNLGHIQLNGKKFFQNYANFCGKMFGLTESTSNVQSFLSNSTTILSRNMSNRHLKFQTVSPFFWIEPTSLFSESTGSLAEKYGFGPIAFLNSTISAPFFEKIQLVQDLGQVKYCVIKFRSARTSPLLIHLSGNADDGLANIIPWNFVSESVVQPGGTETPNDLRERHSDISKYLWGRGQSTIFPPGECNYIETAIGARFVMATFDEDFCDFKDAHIPNAEELLTGSVNMRAGRPYRIRNGKIGSFPKVINKSYTIGAKALQSACRSNYAFNVTGGEGIISSNTSPVFLEIDDTVVNAITGESVALAGASPSLSKGPHVPFRTVDDTTKPKRPNLKSGGQKTPGSKLKPESKTTSDKKEESKDVTTNVISEILPDEYLKAEEVTLLPAGE